MGTLAGAPGSCCFIELTGRPLNLSRYYGAAGGRAVAGGAPDPAARRLGGGSGGGGRVPWELRISSRPCPSPYRARWTVAWHFPANTKDPERVSRDFLFFCLQLLKPSAPLLNNILQNLSSLPSCLTMEIRHLSNYLCFMIFRNEKDSNFALHCNCPFLRIVIQGKSHLRKIV